MFRSLPSKRPSRSRGRRLRWFWLLVAVLFAGCTSIKLVYPRLDWYTHWRLGKYLHLSESQEALARQDIDAFWAWHRADELPRYAADLRAIAAVDAETIDADQLRTWGERMTGYGRVSLERAMPGLCAFAKTIDDPQVASIGKRMDEDLKKFADEHVEPDEDDRRRDEEKSLAKQVKRWTGALNDAQERELKDWRKSHPLLGEETLALRRDWRTSFLAILARHDDPEQCAALEHLLTQPRALRSPEVQARFDASEDQLRRTLSRIIAASDERQRAHARKELLQFAADLDALSRNP